MIYFLLFVLELGLLFFVSKKLINSLAKTFFKFNFSHKTVVHILAILFLPGTILHELAHLLVAGVLLTPVGELSVLPEVEGESVKLGSVQIGKVVRFMMSLVGGATVIFGVVAILFILSFFNFSVWWQAILGLYLIFEIGNSMFSSKKDLEGVIWFLASILVISILSAVTLYIASPMTFQNILMFFNSLDLDGVIKFLKQANIYLLIPLVLDLFVIFLAKILRSFRL